MYARLLAAGGVGNYLPDLVVYHHIPPKRLTKRYFRQWAYSDGRTSGSSLRAFETKGEPQARSAFGAPLWMWRRMVEAAGRAARGYALGRTNDAETFTAELDLRQFLGFYVEHNLPFLRHKHYDRT